MTTFVAKGNQSVFQPTTLQSSVMELDEFERRLRSGGTSIVELAFGSHKEYYLRIPNGYVEMYLKLRDNRRGGGALLDKEASECINFETQKGFSDFISVYLLQRNLEDGTRMPHKDAVKSTLEVLGARQLSVYGK